MMLLVARVAAASSGSGPLGIIRMAVLRQAPNAESRRVQTYRYARGAGAAFSRCLINIIVQMRETRKREKHAKEKHAKGISTYPRVNRCCSTCTRLVEKHQRSVVHKRVPLTEWLTSEPGRFTESSRVGLLLGLAKTRTI